MHVSLTQKPISEDLHPHSTMSPPILPDALGWAGPRRLLATP